MGKWDARKLQTMCREPTASGAEAGGRDGVKRPDDLCITQGFGVNFCVWVGELAYAKIMTNPQPKRLRRRA